MGLATSEVSPCHLPAARSRVSPPPNPLPTVIQYLVKIRGGDFFLPKTVPRGHFWFCDCGGSVVVLSNLS